MIKSLLLIASLVSPFIFSAQSDSIPTPSDSLQDVQTEEVFSFVTNPPSYPGGDEAMYKFIDEQFVYPKYCLENSIQGSVYVSFVVEKDGSTSDHKVVRSVSYGEELNKEALRVCRMLNGFTAGMDEGKTVRSHKTVQIKCSLSDERKKSKKQK